MKFPATVIYGNDRGTDMFNSINRSDGFDTSMLSLEHMDTDILIDSNGDIYRLNPTVSKITSMKALCQLKLIVKESGYIDDVNKVIQTIC